MWGLRGKDGEESETDTTATGLPRGAGGKGGGGAGTVIDFVVDVADKATQTDLGMVRGIL